MVNDSKRIAVIGISLSVREDTSKQVNQLLSDFGNLIIGRMGVPYREKELNVISLIVDGTNDEIGALTGKLGNIKNVKAKVSFMV
jgi:putative iron-only hydrogenase system regulator